MSDFNPSKYQQAIFDWLAAGSGNAIVSAVAGSGKTTTLVEASRRLGNKRLFFAAFNRHIVSTLKARLPQDAHCRTIHSVGYGCLVRKFGRKPEVREGKYRHYCKAVSHRMHDRLQNEYEAGLLHIRDTEDIPPPPPTPDQIYAQLDALVTLCRCTLVEVGNLRALYELIAHFAIDCPIDIGRVQPVVRYILDQGLRDAEEHCAVDYLDMIWLPHIWKLMPESYDWIFVDEAQDLNAAQLALVRKMSDAGTRLLFVGDPRQAIYGFAGADSQSYYKIREFTKATEFPLSICYRCADRVVELAQGLVPEIEPAPDAPEGEVQEIPESQILSYVRENDLVLSRRTEALFAMCLNLLSNRIRAYIKGKELGASLVAIIEQIEAEPDFKFPGFIESLNRFLDESVLKLKEKPDSERQIDDLKDQIASIEVCYTSFSVKSVLQLKAEIKALFDDRQAAVTLSTIHKAKGLENKRVFILDYDSLPLRWENQKDWQYTQELNLKYVAVTRAQASLFLVKDDK
jgi:DNA helicase-2/ATP-dependent DNA helicase PcrA